MAGSTYCGNKSIRRLMVVVNDASLTTAAAVSPAVSSSAELRYGNTTATAQVNGVSADYFEVHAYTTVAGEVFDTSDVTALTQVGVIDTDTRDTFFGTGA